MQTNILKAERHQQQTNQGHPSIQTFASPSITPSNNYRRVFKQDLGSAADRPQTAHLQQLNNFKRDDFLQLYNHAGNSNQFNQTNKEIQKKQFDFNIKNQRANVTIQYDDKVPSGQISQPSRIGGHFKGSKSIGGQHQKKRQQSSSIPKHHQPSASIVNTSVQPLINLHIQNAKMANQASQIQQTKFKSSKKTDQSTMLKYTSVPAGNQSMNQQSSHTGKSKSKNGRYKDQNKGQQQLSNNSKQNILKMSKKLLNKSHLNGAQTKNGAESFLFSFDNKENQSINYNEFSPSRIMDNKNGNKKNKTNFLDSDSSLSSPKLISDHQHHSKLGKSYFMDKSALLKQLSPDRSQRATSKYSQQPLSQQQVVSDRDGRRSSKEPQNYRSHGTTITNLHLQNNLQLQAELPVTQQKGLETSKNIRLNRAGTSNSNKISANGVEKLKKLVQDNLKKIRTKEDEEVTKRFQEEYRLKIKRAELSQRNQEVRKINASKILYNHKHKNSQLQYSSNVAKVAYKKHRSKSCMNKTDNIFGGIARSKERQANNINAVSGNKQQQAPTQLQPQVQSDQNVVAATKKDRKREKSFVLELKELNKQVNDEIRREILAGKLEVPTTTNKRTNMTTINAKNESITNKKDLLNMSVVDSKLLKHHIQGNSSKGDIHLNQQFKRRKSKSRDAGAFTNATHQKNISVKIKKFIQQKKKLQTAAKSLEQTIENDKQLKIQENLKNLSNYVKNVKNHGRQQSYSFNFKKPQLNKDQSGSDKQVQGNVNEHIKKLRPHFLKTKKGSKERQSHPTNQYNGQFFKFDQNEDRTYPMQIDNYMNENDISNEFIDEYKHIINYQDNTTKKYQSISIEISPKREHSASKKKFKGSRKENSIEERQSKGNGRRASQPKKIDSDDSDSQGQLTAIKANRVVQVKPNNIPTLIPPQSEIATLDKNQTKSNISLKAPSTGQKSHQRVQRSPSTMEFQKKMKVLNKLYGHNIQREAKGSKISDTNLLIRLHSAAITIQQQVRKHLQREGFYESEQSEDDRVQSPMYVDSEQDEEYDYEFTSGKKQRTSKLIAQTSPLRVKGKNNPNKYQINDDNNQQNSKQQAPTNKFYSEDSSDVEKVIVCSVISSARPDGNQTGNEESLQNTQKYVPLRQKKKGVSGGSQVSSLPNSGFNTAIKTADVAPLSRFEQPQVLEDSQRRIPVTNQNKFIPSLNLDKLNNQPQITKPVEEESKRDLNSTQRSIFKRDAYQEFKSTHPTAAAILQHPTSNTKHQFPADFPELLKLKEEAILCKENEQQLLIEMYKQKKVSPRTYNEKRRDLEKWVSKEKEEVKKHKLSYEEERQKILQMMNDTKKTQEHMKQLLFTEQPNQMHSRREYNPNDTQTSHRPLHSQRATSHRESALLDLINNTQSSNEQQQELAKLKAIEEAKKQRLLEEQAAKLKMQEEADKKAKEEEARKKAALEAEAQKLKAAEEQQRKAKEDAEKQAAIEAKQQKAREENERLAREEAAAQVEAKRKAEEQARKQLEDKRLEQERQDKAAKQELLRKQQEEDQRKARDLQIQEERKQQEIQRQKQQEEQDRRDREAAQLKKQQEQEEQQRLIENQKLQEAEQKRLQEEALKQQKLEEEQRLQKEEQQRKVAAEKKRLEQEENERKKKEQEAAAELKRQEEEERKERELAQIRAKQEEIEKKRVQDELEEKQRIKNQKEQQKKNRYASQDPDDLYSEPGFDDDYDFSSDKNKPIYGQSKEILSSSENDQPISIEEDDQANNHSPQKGLSRTRSSQYLNDREDFKGSSNGSNKADDYQIQDNDSDQIEKSQDELDSAQRKKILDGLDHDSEDDTTDFNQSINKKQKPVDITSPNFFTNNFDQSQAEDVISQIQNPNRNSDGSQENPDSNQSHILIQGDHSIDDEEKKFDIYGRGGFGSRIQQQVIPTEQHNNFYHGAPVSPASQDGNNNEFRIQTGSQSLESTLSDNDNLRRVIHDVAVSQAQQEQIDTSSVQQPQEIDQQVDQVTDDIFRSLIAEMKVELDLLLLADPRRLYELNAANGSQQANFSESGRFLIFERRGIKTDLFAIERYVEEVLDEVLRDNNRFMTSIQSAINRNPREVLNQLQNSEIGSYEHFQSWDYPAVLPLDLYLKLEKRRKEKREQEQRENQIPVNADRNFLAECEHIHNKVLFDCINDSLLQFKQNQNILTSYRPYGKDGNPLPWSRQNRRLKPIEDFTVEEMFEIVKHDLFRWAIMQAGTLPRREFVLGGVFDDELFAEIREKKLATLLAREMIENEPKWLCYEFEEAQVKIDVGDMILEQMVTEAITFLNAMANNGSFAQTGLRQ